MKKTFEYRIYPNTTQRNQIAQTFGCCRWIYNHALGIRKAAYERREKEPSIFDCMKNITLLKQQPDTEWLKNADSVALHQSLRDLDKAYKNFFRAPGKVGFPKFKSKRSRQSYRTTKVSITADEKYIKLPKLGLVKARIPRATEGRILSATIKQVASGKYFVTICCDCKETPLPKTDKIIGIDLGSRKLISTSNGELVRNPKFYRATHKKLAKEQRRLARKKGARKGETQSNNYKKQKLRVARIQEKIANQRKDFAHKATTRLINENQVIVAESLKVKNMVRNHHFSKAISDAGWGEILRQLNYKAEWYGRVFVQVDPFFPSSQLCSVCGRKESTVKDLRERWVCPACNTEHDRDINAAKNILYEGLRMIGRDTPESNACGESVSPASASAVAGQSR